MATSTVDHVGNVKPGMESTPAKGQQTAYSVGHHYTGAGLPAVHQGNMWEVLGQDIGRWGDYQVQEDERVNHRWLAMPEERWQDYCRRQIRYAKNVNAAMRWVDRMNTKRHLYIPPQPTPDPIRYVKHEPLHTDFLVLQDYVDEPWKYGDDVCETIALEEQLKQTPKAWRVHAMWLRKAEEDKQEEEKNAVARAYAAIPKFQALVRGHQTRCRNGWTSCAHCLCHRVSTWWAGDEERPVCEDCYNQIRQNLRLYREFDAPMF